MPMVRGLEAAAQGLVAQLPMIFGKSFINNGLSGFFKEYSAGQESANLAASHPVALSACFVEDSRISHE
jgi:hypothetical protein